MNGIINKLPKIPSVVLALIAAGADASAQQLTTLRRVADLNPGSGGSTPVNMKVFGPHLYFSAYTLSTGKEVWYYDGTSISLLADINETMTGSIGNDSSPSWFTPVGDRLCFSAFDPRRGGELWRYDGINTVRIADINPDLNDTIKTTPANSWPTELAVLDGTLYFSANGGGSKPNHELWKSDGSSVVLVANINTNTSGSDLSSYPKYLTELNGALYFMADDGVNGYELWKVTQAGASLFANLNPGSATSHSYPKFFTPLDGFLYFQAVNNTNGYELWKTDGSSAPVRIDLRVGSGSSFPEFFAGFRGELYFRATNGTTGYELWKYNGTTASLASNINPTGDSFPKNLIVFKDNLYFAANDGVNGWELWKYDGVSSSLVANLNPSGDSFPENLVIAHDILYFVATTPATGYEVWKYDGISVTLAADVNPGPNPSNPRNLVAFKNELCFSASIDGVEDWELWRILAAPFRVTSIERTGGDIHLTWNTLGGTTNVVQVSDGGVGGPYVNLSAPMVIPGVSPTTADYSHVGGAAPGSRFYRIVQP